MDQDERDALVERLRQRYLAGTLDEVLVPEDPRMDRLLADLFPELDLAREGS
jgi:hypothetical protein